MRDTFLKKGNNDEFIFLNSSRAIAQLVEQWIVKRLKRFFFSERFQNHTLCWNHRKSYAFEKAYDFGTILLFSSISTRRTTYSLIKLARKVGTVHTKIVLDYDSRRVSVSRTRRRCFFPLNFFDHLNSSLNPRSTQ